MKTTHTIDNTEDLIDSRDVIERIEALTPGLTDDDRTELATLRALRDEASQCSEDWEYGETLIRDSYFETYAKELAGECYEIPNTWPHRCIDWKKRCDGYRDCYDFTDELNCPGFV